MRELAADYGLSFDITIDGTLDGYGEVACEGGRDALGGLLSRRATARSAIRTSW